MASAGYPGSYEKGKTIEGLDAAAKLRDVKVFHAGTKMESGRIVTEGGRVLAVTALGDTLLDAKQNAYEAVRRIRYQGAFWRRDIADKALNPQPLVASPEP
jgi:phosphoribosylamine--glycine ligase